MMKRFERILNHLLGEGTGERPLTAIPVRPQFQPRGAEARDDFRNLNAAFLVSLCGPRHPGHERCEQYIRRAWERYPESTVHGFYGEGAAHIRSEIEQRYRSDADFRQSLDDLYFWLQETPISERGTQAVDRVWQLFFPEGVGLRQNRQTAISALRGKRAVRVTRLNPNPIRDPGREIVFTANVLLTLPPDHVATEQLDLSDQLKARIEPLRGQPQRYWYDHPVQIGTPMGQNEVVYGLQGLNRAVAEEKKLGTVRRGARVVCILSVSVTHRGLHDLAGDYLRETLGRVPEMDHLEVYVFTERDVRRLVGEVIEPAGLALLGRGPGPALGEVIGVDGEYGRHFSFLKAVAALWQVMVDPDVRATFKIDLDQVFPQDLLVRETGRSAFSHLCSPLWGASGTDPDGRQLNLGMIAGSLVNRRDSHRSLFTADVPFPEEPIRGDEWIFFSRLPQALSTEAEMLARYRGPVWDGEKSCLQRVHVTGGTCGIRVDSLRRYRPFTPGFIGRAEDQAYMLSVLFQSERGGCLRYVHQDGLIMRHDTEAFAGGAVRAAATGKLIGDYVRLLRFSAYAEALPWPPKEIKDLIDPYVGCFVSRIPLTVTYLRLALKVAAYFQAGEVKNGSDLVAAGTRRLHPTTHRWEDSVNGVRDQFDREKRVWARFYDTLDAVEAALRRGDATARSLREHTLRLIGSSRVSRARECKSPGAQHGPAHGR